MMTTRGTLCRQVNRGFATEKQLRMRIVGTQNIAKITKSMKMVSAAKLRGDQQRLQSASPFQNFAKILTGEPKNLEDIDITPFPKKNLIVVMTTDKGLCGGVNSILTRMTKQMLNKLENAGKEYEIMVLGEKGRAQLRGGYKDKCTTVITERSIPYTFDLASAITNDILGKDVEAIHIVYNQFKSAIKYVPSLKTITPPSDPVYQNLEKFSVSPRKSSEVLFNIHEYALAAQVYHSLLENATSEQSSRMQAMENASKNAGEMIDKLRLVYNRARQARITTELIEIISGAAAIAN